MSGLQAVYLFGSVGRGDADALSDLDILAIVEDGSGKVAEAEVVSKVPNQWSRLAPSISWYGRRRLAEMFANGDLFAWHLFLETIRLEDKGGILSSLGRPAPYREAYEDIRSFSDILAGIPSALAEVDRNAVYEAGLIYVCLRNIGMAASSKLANAPDFSRYSVLRLPNFGPCPLQRSEFELTMRCRMAGRRGLEVGDPVNASWVLGVHDRVAPWLADLMEHVK